MEARFRVKNVLRQSGFPTARDSSSPAMRPARVIAKSHFRNGGANLPVCRDDPQVVTHHFGNDILANVLK
jgi:hypothetical protein